MAVELRVLGPLDVVGVDGPVAFSGQQQRRLLTALVLARGVDCRAEVLADAIWSGDPPATARKLVQQYISQLRKELPGEIRIVTRSTGYAVEVDDENLIDSVRFERLAHEAAAALEASNAELAVSLADQALGLWRGRAYENMLYEHVAQADAQRLEELRLAVTEDRLDALLRLGAHDETVAETLALAEAEPLRERVQELVMLALYRAGRQTEALARFDAYRRRLDEELGLQPGRSLRDLQRRILQQDASLDAPAADVHPSGALPLATTPLVGRSRELDLLEALLARRELRLLVLTGAGGSGKTRLALEAARRAASTFANGAILVELAPVRDPSLVPRAIADACHLGDLPEDALLDGLSDALAGRELLLVVDNAEHVREAAHVYVQLVQHAPRLTVLITSRAVLHISGEHVVPVAPLELEDAVALFSQRASALDPAFALTAANRGDVEEICTRVDGLPLAVELAAARVRTLTPRVLRERLDARLAVLTTTTRDLPARQRTLRDTIAWSADLLSDRARGVLVRLAVFPAGATLDAAEHVCAADVETLSELVDDHVVLRVDATDERRYGLLETIREYAYELLGDERAAVEHAMGDYLASFIESGVRGGPTQEAWLTRLDAELDNVRAAIGSAAEANDVELELRLAGGMFRYWWIRGPAGEGLARIEAALGRVSREPTPALAQALHGAAGLLFVQGAHEAAAARAEEAVEVARVVGATWNELAAETVLALVAMRNGEYDLARGHLRRGTALKELLGMEPLAEMMNLGNVEHATGDFAAAAQIFDELAAIHRASGSLEGIGLASLNLGLARYRLGEIALAQSCFEEAREGFDELGFRAHAAHASQGLAACALACGRPTDAAALLGRAAYELAELGWSDDDFDVTLATEVERRARAALGDDAFEDAFAGWT